MLENAKLLALVGSTNQERALAFYRDALGLRLVEDDGFALIFDTGGTTLRVSRVERVDAAPYAVLSWEVEDIATAAKALATRGVVFERYSQMEHDADGLVRIPGGPRLGWFKDPDGNILGIVG